MVSFPVLAAGGITDINPGLTLWTGITFLVLLFVLGKFAWGPIVKMLAERERTIREAIDSAKRERTEAERLLAEQKALLGKAAREAAELARRNQQEVEAMRQELTARARKEADDLVATARKQIEEEKTKAMSELRAVVADLAIDAASRLVKANLDDASQRKLVEDYIAQLPANRAA
ncbi:F0F1 ATP synthase subunit B [Anaeromyxobacter sp. Fw109-5]|uniref:ATP synthase subunit b n=1 Tax=Anaeromyxobacter sp. (strain Fw109-5) TaxID=404589 RepID=ATPF_ANADF|nr:F0F1 ATP synthase subunit B [Anaeromyxobacter sp. Fw109-5]A7HIW7.1 RecName: Full=ATP synthase subunit b; AltName: Full=ATP synthase F(0) sector subunit b; AltName: Full=ATPase subunit I; AltName: Full=F-type ATPase subunit b; Short=F-ATPase subunit b [Anaeromyxobacter sp. Fw109-5]ABS28663.1 ATP synthase F0, B subunit [Anaeromyxobacter sp. Fw109-5]